MPENRIDELRSGEASSASCCGRIRPQIYPARVREIAPAVDPMTRTFAVRVSIVDAGPRAAVGHDRQRRCCAASARQRRAAAADVALSAAMASRRCGSTTRRRSKVEPAAGRGRRVSRGRRRRDARACSDGEWVVAAGVHKLTDGQTVRPYEGAPARATDASTAPPACRAGPRAEPAPVQARAR